MNASDLSHEKFQQRMLAFSLGWLEEAQEESFRRHRDACGSCRQQWEEYDQRDDGTGGGERHLPAAMIARWPHATSSLQGVERRAVAKHVGRCDDCRADITMLGYDPEISYEGTPRVAPEALPREMRVEPSFEPSEHSTRPSWSARLTDWLGGGLVGAAVAASLVFLVVRTPGPDTVSAPDGATGSVVPWVAPSTVRGEDNTLQLAPGATRVSVPVAVPLSLDAAQPATLRVVNADDQELLRVSVAPTDLEKSTLVLLLEDQRGLATGRYQVVFEQGDQSISAAFVLRN